MVEIHFPPTQGARMRVRITGHATGAPKGEDLVCAAVSSLLYTMVGGLETEVAAKVSGVMEDGKCDLEVEVPETYASGMDSVARVFRYGFRRLAETYPTYVRMN